MVLEYSKPLRRKYGDKGNSFFSGEPAYSLPEIVVPLIVLRHREPLQFLSCHHHIEVGISRCVFTYSQTQIIIMIVQAAIPYPASVSVFLCRLAAIIKDEPTIKTAVAIIFPFIMRIYLLRIFIIRLIFFFPYTRIISFKASTVSQPAADLSFLLKERRLSGRLQSDCMNALWSNLYFIMSIY
jgi:hypothetical protein